MYHYGVLDAYPTDIITSEG